MEMVKRVSGELEKLFQSYEDEDGHLQDAALENNGDGGEYLRWRAPVLT